MVAERIEDKIGVVGEQVGTNTEKITSLQKDMSQVKENLQIIKLDIGFIKNELKQKVFHYEFTVLEKRVIILEVKKR